MFRRGQKAKDLLLSFIPSMNGLNLNCKDSTLYQYVVPSQNPGRHFVSSFPHGAIHVNMSFIVIQHHDIRRACIYS
jgi:hypothetical protein